MGISGRGIVAFYWGIRECVCMCVQVPRRADGSQEPRGIVFAQVRSALEVLSLQRASKKFNTTLSLSNC